jgi:beta-lactamase regulating signal transducer with metallopeptidase domain
MISWLIETLVATTLLMLVALALRGPTARAFGARWAYALWLVPALRMVLPPLPAWLPQAPLPPVVIFIPTTANLTAPHPAELPANWEWMPFLMALWAGGAVIFLILQWLDYRHFLHRLDASARPAPPSYGPPSYGSVAILVSSEVEGPVALGLLHRKIVVPADFLRRYSPAEQRLAMEHELIHHRRGDMWWNLAALVVLAFNWFNPIAWYAFHAFRSDQELACDAAVAARVSLGERHDYASALVKSASRPGLIAACPLTRVGQLKHRLRMMRSHRITRLRSAGGGIAISALAAGAFAIGTPGFDHEAERQIVYRPAPDAPARLAATAPAAAPRAATSIRQARRASHRQRPAAPPDALDRIVPEPVVLASFPPLEMPELKLRIPPLPAARRASAPRRASTSTVAVRVYGASVTLDGDPQGQLKLEIVEQLLSRLKGADEAELQAVKSALERLPAHVKVKVVHSTIREDGV